MFKVKFHPFKFRKKLINRSQAWRMTDMVFIATSVIATLALAGLIYYQVRPLELVDIKVPVSTVKPQYYPGEMVSGIFFGEVYYQGRVTIERDVFCAGYRERILTDEGDPIFSGNSRPNKLEGAERRIGRLPDDVPVGKNCVIQFVNSYDIKTPFGTRHEERAYYTQNFLIVERPQEIEQEEDSAPALLDPSPSQSASGNSQIQTSPQTNNSQSTQTPVQPPSTESPRPAEPVSPPQQCTINLLGIKLLCR